jgi:hypothetical protein
LRRSGREIEVLVNGNSLEVIEQLKRGSPEAIRTDTLTLEEIFVASLKKTEEPV